MQSPHISGSRGIQRRIAMDRFVAKRRGHGQQLNSRADDDLIPAKHRQKAFWIGHTNAQDRVMCVVRRVTFGQFDFARILQPLFDGCERNG